MLSYFDNIVAEIPSKGQDMNFDQIRFVRVYPELVESRYQLFREWSATTPPVFEGKKALTNDDENHFCPTILLLKDATELVLYEADGSIKYIFSPDGENWSDEMLIASDYSHPRAIYLSEQDRIFLVCYKLAALYAVWGSYDGSSFSFHEPEQIVASGALAEQPSLLATPNGTLILQYTTTQDQILLLTSSDFGQTWS